MPKLHLPTKSHTVPGLGAPVEILLDRWGIPHIYAGSRDDVFLAQGFNAARDRLWQVDLWRKRGLGELARDFGRAYLDQDRAARLMLYRGPLEPEWTHYGAQTRTTLEAFVAGINAYVAMARSDPSYLPVEFGLLDYLPAYWQAEDILRIRSHSLVRNVISEVERARVARAGGLDADRLRIDLQPQWQTEVPAGLDLGSLPDDLLDTYLLATGGVSFAGATLRNASPRPAVPDGSNNWAIAPSKSSTGRAIFANDPHRAHSVPSLRYIVHLSAPGIDAIGAGQPYLPGISTGHNARVSFGFTVFQIDQEDLYVYDLDPDEPDRYRYRDGFEDIHVIREDIAVRGGEAAEAVHRFTRHGPVIHVDAARNTAYAVRTVLLEPGAAPYLASLAYLDAADWHEVRDALRRWHVPALSFVGADTAGNIGWATCGLAPVRGNWDGLLPVPGDGRYEWDGFLDADDLPWETNPACGWVASANQMSLPADYPYRERKLGFEWSDPARYQRLTEYFEHTPAVSLADCRRLQTEVVCIPARRLCGLLAGLADRADLGSDDPTLAGALALLGTWNHALAADSAAAALFEVWFTRHLCPAVIAGLVPAAAGALIPEPDTLAIVSALETPDPGFGESPGDARDDLLRATLSAAALETQTLLGEDWSGWTWGRLHAVRFEHPLSHVAGADWRERLDVGPYPLGGSDLTLNKARYRPADFGVVHGPSWRIVADVGNWDDTFAVNAPGQSGDPSSPHYRDLSVRWAAGEYVRLPYTRVAVEGEARDRLTLGEAGEERSD